MRDVQRIAIVDPSDVTREELRNVLLGMESIWLEAECARYDFFFDVISQSSPDVVVISLDSDQTKALQLIAQLTQEAPDLPILAISARGDGQAILQALRSGAREFLTAPVVLEELLKALQRLQRSRGPGESRNGDGPAPKVESQVIAVLGSRGGVGCTTLAVNLGASISQEPGHSVALIDLDLALGDADVALDLMADYTLADVALNIDRLDMQFLRRSLSKHSSGLSLLPHPVQMEDATLIREDHLQRVIGLLRASYTHLVLDLSKSFSPNDVTALRMADVILLVAQLELSSLRNVVRMLLMLGADEQLGPKVQVVVNRVDSDPDISVKKAEETIGKLIYWQVPNDTKLVIEARNQGVPLVQHAPRSKVQQSILGLAHALCGKEQVAAPKEKARWALFSRK
ncbi:MAG TPA: response regulator [Gemmataceae bacterium]|jgi:pilus assembly protein CpaE|nr:response regulator [Gemmataceae bacterium]